MALEDTIFQWPIFGKIIWPFLLIFALVFAILEKTKVLGEDKKQVNAIIALVIGMVFVGAVYPVDVVNNLILFMIVALVVLFVFLMLYGFVVSDAKEGFKVEKWMKWVFGILAGIAVVVATIWATGADSAAFYFLFSQPWSEAFWTNALFVVLIVIVIAVVLKGSKKS